jgi:uncharacterized protein YciI
MHRYSILCYDYVDGMLERRTPYRDEHLARIAAEHEAGRLVMAGALGDPPHGGLFVFAEGVGPEQIEAFADADPYTRGGLVTARRIEPWTVVT